MTSSPTTAARRTAAGAAHGGGTVVRVAALTPPRPTGGLRPALANEVRFVAAARSTSPALRAAMARAGAILLQSGPESPDAAKVDISVASRTMTARHPSGEARPPRRRTRRYADRRAAAVR